MRIKETFVDLESYLEFAYKFIRCDKDKVWRDSDIPLLTPFFESDKNNFYEWTEDIRESFDYYLKCKDEYGDELFEIRDSCSQFSEDEIADFFFLEHPDDYLEEDEEITKDKLRISEEFLDEFVFPICFIGFIDSSFDRCGNLKSSFSDFFSLTKELECIKNGL